jgi:ABC-type uncharacterized transport system involved in gliding motility auxiliary subunit
MNKNFGRVCGLLGALFLVFAFLAYVFIAREFNWMVYSQLALGVALLGAGAATALDDLQNIATGRGSVFVITNSIGIAALIGALIGINYKVYKAGKEWDLTKDQIHTLADQTQSLVKGLTDANKVTVYAFYQLGEPGQSHLEDLLKRYKTLNTDHFDYQFTDFYKNAELAKQMNVTQSGARIVLKSANGKESRVKDVSEEALTNGLAELGHGVEKKVYFLSGDGERPLDDEKNPMSLKGFVDQLKEEGFKTAPLSLLASKEVPSDAAALIIAGPHTDLVEGELDAIKNYANNGGRLAVFLDPGSSPSLEPVVRAWGADPMSGVILDTSTRQPVLAVGVPSQNQTHPILKGATSALGVVPALFADARGIRKGNATGFTVTELYDTTEKAWSENDPIDPTGQKGSEPGGPNDVNGPIPLGVATSKKLDGEKELRAVVFGDSDFLTNQLVGKYGNRDLALNIVQWLGGEDSKITIRPKLREKSTVTMLTKEKLQLLSFGSLNVLPLAIIAVGLSVWSSRKSK